MVSWGQIGAALFEGTTKGLENAAVSEDKRIEEKKKLYEAQAEAAKRQAEENKGNYTKQVGDFTSRMKQISSVLLDVKGGIDKKTADKLAYNLVRVHGLDANSFSNLQSLITTAKKDGGSLYTAEALQLALDPNTAFNLDDVATSMVPSYDGYDKLKPPDSSYTMPWLFGGGKPKSLETAARTADANASGLMSPKDVDGSGYPKIDIAPPFTPSKYAREQAEGGGNGPSKVYIRGFNANLNASVNTPLKTIGPELDEKLRRLMVSSSSSENLAAQTERFRQLYFQHKAQRAYKSPEEKDAWRTFFTDTAEGRTNTTVNLKRLDDGFDTRMTGGDGRILMNPSDYANLYKVKHGTTDLVYPKSEAAKKYNAASPAGKREYWRRMLSLGYLIDEGSQNNAFSDYIDSLVAVSKGG
jgi:hypothetical protein